jgi:hypothetical protein
MTPLIRRVRGPYVPAMATDQSAQKPPLPYWPEETVALLSACDHRLHAVPIAAILRAGDRRILFCLHRAHWSPALRKVALTVLGPGVAFSARGRAGVLEEALVGERSFVALELIVEAIDDHGAIGYSMAVMWSDERKLEEFRERISALQWLAP